MLVAIQELSTHWTKASRGSPRAAQRSAIPRALTMLGARPRFASTDVLHRIQYDEYANFEARVLDEATSGRHSYSEIWGLSLLRDGDRTRVSYRWNMACGAPERSGSTPTWLEPGTWCQILHNGRFGLDNPWSYRSTVINVAVLTEFEPDVFLTTAPARIIDCLADLW